MKEQEQAEFKARAEELAWVAARLSAVPKRGINTYNNGRIVDDITTRMDRISEKIEDDGFFKRLVDILESKVCPS